MAKPNTCATTPAAAVDRLEELYARATTALADALDRYVETRKPPSPKARATFPKERLVLRSHNHLCKMRSPSPLNIHNPPPHNPVPQHDSTVQEMIPNIRGDNTRVHVYLVHPKEQS